MARAMKLRHRTGLGDPLLEDLTRGALGVAEREVGVDRRVPLPVGGVDLRLGDDRLEAEGAGLVGDDRGDQRSRRSGRARGSGAAGRRPSWSTPPGRPTRPAGRRRPWGRGAAGGLGRTTRAGTGPFSTCAPGHQVLVGLGALGRPVVRREVASRRDVGDLLGQVEPVPQRQQLGLGHLLDLVGGVAGLDLGAERPALDRLGQDDGRRAALLGGQLVGGVELAVVVAAAGQRPQLVVAQVFDQPAQPRVGTEEVLADVGARLGRVLLELAVDGGVHLVEQHAVDVTGQQLVPARAPDDLDDVPAGTPEDRLELLDDLAVAPHRTVEPLQVAVDDEDQVVEVLAPGHAECADRLGLVHLAVADEAPDPALARVDQLAQVEVAVDVGLVDRRDRAEAHRHRRELPEVGQEPGVRVARAARCPPPRGGSCPAGPRSADPRRTPGRRCPGDAWPWM